MRKQQFGRSALFPMLIVLAVVPTIYAQVGAGSGAASTQPASRQANVPVREVVLFSSGVGYFEHFGSVPGNGSTELRFKTDQINDVLKSLLLQDLDGGKVAAVSYDSQAPLAHRLKSFQVDITANPSMADLLNGSEEVVGNCTSGGTESILLAVKTARDAMEQIASQ